MRNVQRAATTQDHQYHMQTSPFNTRDDATSKEGSLSSTKPLVYAHSPPIDEDHDGPQVNLEPRTRTLMYARRQYFRLFRLVVSFTFGCLTAITVFHLIWRSPQDARPDRLDELFPMKKSQPNIKDVPSEERFEVFMPSVVPIRCHSHNDYWRRTPLYAAIGSGCISVEADVWAFEDDLFVGHEARALTPEATLSSIYLDPIERLLQDANQPSKIGGIETDGNHGVFSAVAEQTLILLIDFKTDSSETYHRLNSQLSSLRNKGWLTHWNGTNRIERPLTIVVSGNVPFEEIIANKTYRDIFADAPLGALDSPEDNISTSTEIPESFDSKMLLYKYNPSNSYYSSMDIKKILGLPLLTQYSITPQNIQALEDHIHAARVRGLVPRFWGTPIWPRNFRDYVWGLMMELGVGVLNVDDLRAVRMGNWGRWSQRRDVDPPA